MGKNETTLFSVLMSIVTYLFGGIDSLLLMLLIIMAIDYITGVLKGIYKKEIDSSFGIKGIIKKIGYLLIVILATLFDYLINDNSMAIRTLVIYFFISNEAISILENWGAIGLPLPKKLYDVFDKLKENKKKTFLVVYN